MLTMAILSPGPGSGKNTIIVNLGIGLQLEGYRVLLATDESNCVIRQWLNPINQIEMAPDTIAETTSLNVDLLTKPSDAMYSNYLIALKDLYDYLVVDAGSYQAGVCQDIFMADAIIACIEAGVEHEQLYELEKHLRLLSQGARGIDIVVPSKAKSGEWESNVEQLMRLIENFGEDRVADLIPFCEALHDLPRERKSVWDLPQHYSNRKQAFDRLINYVLQQTPS